jgi:hypothetical protein
MNRLRALSLLLVGSTVCLPRIVQAQELTPPPPIAPPGYCYSPLPPCPAPVDADDRERRGRSKKIAGAIMLGVGAALSVAGIGLLATSRSYNESTHIPLGGTALLVGQLSSIAGIPVYVVGAAQVDRARRWRGQWTVTPLSSSAGSGVVAQVGFPF